MIDRITEVPKVISDDFHENMGSTLFSDYYQAIIQGFDNAWDADASTIELTFEPEKNRLIIKDDGSGMNIKGLEDFNRFGGSIKKLEPYTPNGRLRMGDVGVGKEFLRHLSFAYNMTTIKSGKKHIINEAFVREIIAHSLLKCKDVKSKTLRKQREYIDDIAKQVIKGKSPDNIPEIRDSLLIQEVEKKYGSLEEILNKGTWENMKVIVRETNKKKHSTEIEMCPLRFAEKKGIFELDKLIKEIQKAYALQLGPFFRVKVNGIEIETPIPKDAIVYEIDEQLKRCGKISGLIYYLPHKSVEKHMRGIHLVVGRTIGRGDFFELEDISYAFPAHIYGFVKAEGLKGSLRFDKQNIQYNTEDILELKEHIKNLLLGIRRDILRGEEKEKGLKLVNILKEVTGWVIHRAERKGMLKKGKIELVDSSRSGPVASYDEDSNTVYINKEKRVVDDKNLFFNLRALFFSVCSYAISKHKAITQFEEHGMRNLCSILDEIIFEEEDNLILDKSRTLAQVFEGIGYARLESRPDMLQIFPLRLYTALELRKKTRRDVLVFRRLAEAGLLQERPGERYIGAEAIEALQKIQGYKPLVEIIKENFTKTYMTAFQYLETKLNERVKRLGKKPEYIEDIGKTYPLYVVKNGFEDIFLAKFLKEKLPKKSISKDKEIGPVQSSNYIFEAIGKRVQPKQLIKMSEDSRFPFLKMDSTNIQRKVFYKRAIDQLIPLIEKDKNIRQKYQIM